MKKKRWLMLGMVVALGPVCLGAMSNSAATGSKPLAEAAPDDAGAFFEAKVRPVLRRSCMGCHGERASRGGLRLDSREAMLKGGARGPAIVRGDPDKSLMIAAIGYDGDLQMPPRRKLPDDQIADLRKWVQDGAVWPAAKDTN